MHHRNIDNIYNLELYKCDKFLMIASDKLYPEWLLSYNRLKRSHFAVFLSS